MRAPRLFLLSLVFLLGALGSPGDARGEAPEKKARAEAKEERRVSNERELREALAKERIDWSEAKRCVLWPEEFPGVAVLGSFAHNRGCIYSRYFFGGAIHQDVKRGANTLESFGWSDPKKRPELALTWQAKVVAPWTVLREAPRFPKDFEGRGFTPAKAELTSDGGVRLTYWSMRPAGMTRERRYERVEVGYSSEGDVVEGKSLEQFAADGDDF